MVGDLYQEGLALARAGRYAESLERFDAFLKQRPMHGYCWNDAGTVLYGMGRFDRAIQYFSNALENSDHPPQVYKNLIGCYLKKGNPGQAMRLLETMHLKGLLDQQVIGQIAQGFEQQQDPASAIEVLHRGSGYLDTKDRLLQQIDRIKTKRAKIAFFCGGDGPTFLKDIVDYAKQRYPVRYFEGSTARDVQELMEWSDISWFEWCTELARIGTNLPKVCKIIVRLHRYETYVNWPSQINWKNVDQLITVGNEWVIKALNKWVGDIHQRTSVVTIPNGIDLSRIEFKERKPGKKIAFVAALRMVKNPMLLIQCMAELLKIDPDYKLYIAGEVKDLLILHYLQHTLREMNMEHAVISNGFQNDIPGWLADKNYIVSTSVIESQGMGILEAMTAGIKPVIHNFPGAKETFGDKWLFNTAADFCRQIIETPYNSEEYRQYVERRYSLKQQLYRINEIFAAFESQCGSRIPRMAV